MTFCVSFVDLVVVAVKSTGQSMNSTAWKIANLTKFILVLTRQPLYHTKVQTTETLTKLRLLIPWTTNYDDYDAQTNTSDVEKIKTLRFYCVQYL